MYALPKAFVAGFLGRPLESLVHEAGGRRSLEPLDPLRREIWRLTADDVLDGVDCCANICVLGTTGTGKSSTVLAQLMRAYMARMKGGLFTTANLDDAWLIEEAAKDMGCESQIAVVSPTSEYVFNPLDAMLHDASGKTGSVDRVVELLMTAHEMYTSEGGSAKANESFWRDSAKRYLRHVVLLDLMAWKSINLKRMLGYFVDAPESPEQVNDEAWQEHSSVEIALRNAWLNVRNDGEQGLAKHKELATFWLSEFPKVKADSTRSGIIMTVQALMTELTSDDVLPLLSKRSNIGPSDCWDHGLKIVLDYPIARYGAGGRLLQGMCQLAFMKKVESRDLKQNDELVFIFSDESHRFFSRYLSEFLSYSRGKRCAVVTASQSVASYANVLGGGPAARDQINSFFANFGHDIYLGLDEETAKWAARRIGQKWGLVGNSGGTRAQKGDRSMYAGSSEQLLNQVEELELMQLARAGRDRHFSEAILLRHGGQFSNNRNYLKLNIPQIRKG